MYPFSLPLAPSSTASSQPELHSSLPTTFTIPQPSLSSSPSQSLDNTFTQTHQALSKYSLSTIKWMVLQNYHLQITISEDSMTVGNKQLFFDFGRLNRDQTILHLRTSYIISILKDQAKKVAPIDTKGSYDYQIEQLDAYYTAIDLNDGGALDKGVTLVWGSSHKISAIDFSEPETKPVPNFDILLILLIVI